MGATDKPGSGSRPLNHHIANMTTNAQGGSKTRGLLAKNHAARERGPGSWRIRLGMHTWMLSPPRMASGAVVSKLVRGPAARQLACCSCEPDSPVEAWAR